MEPGSNSSKSEVAYERLPMMRVYKDGRVERLFGIDVVPPSTDPETGVSSKDVTIAVTATAAAAGATATSEPTSHVISARLFLPKLAGSRKLPLLIYFHGGAFCVCSPFTAAYHGYLNAIVAEAQVVAVSVNYRKAPEHPIPAAYEDSWAAIQWAASHCDGGGPEAWLNEHADFGRVFLSGESAGANIVHNMAMAAGNPELGLNIRLLGVGLVHPFFWGSDPIGVEALHPDRRAEVDWLWPLICPSRPDEDEPWVNPMADGAPSLAGLGCGRVLVCVAEKDVLRDRGRLYHEVLGRCGWMGVAEIMETEGEGHGFHLNDLGAEKAKDLIRRLAAFLNRDMPPLMSS
ncbi:probable carboxylesterase 2 [Syzygium oleosum]|uniref:probable carboxylesterase 2 n=1 Tax=Syzygium oleosum TaxID=219896 RepID=UPI0011D2C5A6|nr:probable carboxylesterase 2 [Syzygium oleosum]